MTTVERPILDVTLPSEFSGGDVVQDAANALGGIYAFLKQDFYGIPLWIPVFLATAGYTVLRVHVKKRKMDFLTTMTALASVFILMAFLMR